MTDVISSSTLVLSGLVTPHTVICVISIVSASVRRGVVANAAWVWRDVRSLSFFMITKFNYFLSCTLVISGLVTPHVVPLYAAQ